MAPDARSLFRLGISLWFLAALAAIWELLALQPPDSPLHLGVLVGPIAQLRTFAFAQGCVLALCALWGGGGRAMSVALALGAVLHVAALGYAASRGLLAVQILDPRGDARAVLYVRGLAHTLSLVGLGIAFVRSLRQSS
ncbi:MAG: hypothetical protein ABW352_06555 [Polyangiales bacterium]